MRCCHQNSTDIEFRVAPISLATGAMFTAVPTTPDSFVAKGYLQAHGIDTAALYEEVITAPIWCDRRDNTMRYRGHPLKRTKAFLLTTLPASYPLYRYPGFQYASMLNYRSLDAVPGLAAVLAAIGVNRQPLVCDHVILTLYEEQSDCIGRHQDKLRDIMSGSDIVSISLGASREFELSRGEVATHVEQLEDGDVFVLGPQTNRTMKHAVLPLAQGAALEPRISIVVRHIATAITAEQLHERLG